jgi:hypothetical protein
VSASEQAAWFMIQAAQAYGSRLPAAPGDAGESGPEVLGRNLARLLFGGEVHGRALPAPLAELIARPDSRDTLTGLETHVEETMEQDTGLAAAVDEMLNGFYRQVFDRGDGQALVDLGALLWWDDPARAHAALERALDAGNQQALIDLAKHRRAVLADEDGALLLYRQAAESPDPDVGAEALVELGHMHAGQRDAPAGHAYYQRAIDARRPHWAPMAMIGLGHLLQGQLGDEDGAQVMFRRAIEESGDADSRACALVQLATFLKNHADVTGAKAAWQQAIDSRMHPWAEIAFSALLNQLQAEDDLDGARAAHRAGVETGNPDAPHALVVIGNLLKERGDVDGWRAAWQQAIDTGYDGADHLREILSPADPD